MVQSGAFVPQGYESGPHPHPQAMGHFTPTRVVQNEPVSPVYSGPLYNEPMAGAYHENVPASPEYLPPMYAEGPTYDAPPSPMHNTAFYSNGPAFNAPPSPVHNPAFYNNGPAFEAPPSPVYNPAPVAPPAPIVGSVEREYISPPRGNLAEPVTTILPGKEFITRNVSPGRRVAYSKISPPQSSFTTHSGPFGVSQTEHFHPGYESHFEDIEGPQERVTHHFTPPRAVTTMPPRYVGTHNFIRSPDIPRDLPVARTYYNGVSTTYGDPGKVRYERQPEF